MKISFDLDDVLFVDPKEMETEPPLRFPFNRIYKERLRKGTVDLIKELQDRGFEVLVYTSSLRSIPYIRSLFKHYKVSFSDIINRERHLREVQRGRRQLLPQKMPGHYGITLHVDDEDVIHEYGRTFGFHTIKVKEPDEAWADKIIAEAERLRKLEQS